MPLRTSVPTDRGLLIRAQQVILAPLRDRAVFYHGDEGQRRAELPVGRVVQGRWTGLADNADASDRHVRCRAEDLRGSLELGNAGLIGLGRVHRVHSHSASALR